MAFGLILFLLAVIVIVLALAYQEVSRWLYPPEVTVQAQLAIPELSKITLQTEDKFTIVGWYVPPKNGVAILMLHGHSGNRDQLMPHAKYLLPEGYGVLSIDFRNHGESDGDRTSLGVHELKDARAAYDFLLEQDEVENIVIFGHSMGGAVALRLMHDVDAAGLIITSTFADFPSTVRAGVVARGLPERPITDILLTMYHLLSGADWTVIHPEAQISTLTKPILLMHGGLDPVIPVDHAYRLAAANERVQVEIYEGGTHSDLYEVDPDRFEADLMHYLEQTIKLPS